MSNETTADVPEWLWRTARWGFVAVVLAIAAVALAVALGVADPKPHGTLQWEDHFADAVGRWQTFGGATQAPGGLTVSLGQTGEVGGAVAQGDPVAPCGSAAQPTALDLAILYSFGHQHRTNSSFKLLRDATHIVTLSEAKSLVASIERKSQLE